MRASSCPASDISSKTGTILYAAYFDEGKEGFGSTSSVGVGGGGEAVITGYTSSDTFPVRNAVQPNRNPAPRQADAFVARLNRSGTDLVFSTYFGGSQDDGAAAVRADDKGNTYVAGGSASSDFPTFRARVRGFLGGADGFVARFSPDGSLAFSTYLGGGVPGTDEPADESGAAIALDGSGNIYVTGQTYSADFPTRSAFQRRFTPSVLGGEVFVIKLSPDGRSLLYSTFLGGGKGERHDVLAGDDAPSALAVDAAGNAYLCGTTHSSDFPVKNALQPRFGGGETDAFVAKFDPAGRLVYSTYLGGGISTENQAWPDEARGIALTSGGDVWVCGMTNSADFPTLDPLQPEPHPGLLNFSAEGFLTRISERGGSPGGRLSFSPRVLNFGTVRVGATRRKRLVLLNTGSDPLRVTVGATPYDDDTFVAYRTISGGRSFTVAPGARHVVVLEFAPQERGLRPYGIAVTTNSPRTPVSHVRLLGKGKR